MIPAGGAAQAPCPALTGRSGSPGGELDGVVPGPVCWEFAGSSDGPSGSGSRLACSGLTGPGDALTGPSSGLAGGDEAGLDGAGFTGPSNGLEDTLEGVEYTLDAIDSASENTLGAVDSDSEITLGALEVVDGGVENRLE
jgi:hypothetical protein